MALLKETSSFEWSPSRRKTRDPLLLQIFNTFYILILTEIILIPISLAAAIYLMEYAWRGPLLSVIHFAAETLSGVHSIVLGLFGYLFFCTVLGFRISRLSGALTLLCLNFPIALRLFEDALASVPNEHREGSQALGATKWQLFALLSYPLHCRVLSPLLS